MTRLPLAFVLAWVSLTALAPVTAQGPQNRTVWDGVYTAEQATAGAPVFLAQCASCHGTSLEGGQGPALAGPRFMTSFETDTVRRLFESMSTRMPQGRAGTLSPEEYLSLSAFVLQSNGFPAGATPLAADATDLGFIRIIGKDGPSEATNGRLASVVGCLTQDQASAWVIANAGRSLVTRNQDLSKDGALAEAASRALGSDRVRLMFLEIRPTTVAPLKGTKVEAKGLLIVNAQGRTINLSSIQSVAAACE